MPGGTETDSKGILTLLNQDFKWRYRAIGSGFAGKNDYTDSWLLRDLQAKQFD